MMLPPQVSHQHIMYIQSSYVGACLQRGIREGKRRTDQGEIQENLADVHVGAWLLHHTQLSDQFLSSDLFASADDL